MGQLGKYLMKVNDFDVNFVSSLSLLKESEEFFDVTLVSDDEIQIKAHKVVLSASSPFFRNVLKFNKTPSPLLYIRGVTNAVLGNVVEFLYKGEAEVAENDLDNFLKLSKDLKLTGLSENDVITNDDVDSPIIKEEETQINQKFTLENKKRKKVKKENPGLLKLNTFDNSKDVNSVDILDVHDDSKREFPGIKDNAELDAKISEMMMRKNSMWHCKGCGVSKKRKSNMQVHIEINHMNVPQPCSFCDVVSRNRPGLSFHVKKHHSDK